MHFPVGRLVEQRLSYFECPAGSVEVETESAFVCSCGCCSGIIETQALKAIFRCYAVES